LEGTTTYDVFADASWCRTPTDGYEATREAAMAAFAKRLAAGILLVLPSKSRG
jgi:hypothetical protein